MPILSTRNKRYLITVLGLTALLAGCLKPRLPPPSTLDISQLDLGPIKGKIIVIDPGHGGPERGAVGEKGLNEAEVNLGVALYLWGLLKDAGAQPVLTRSSDTSVFIGEDFDLKQDLQARSQISNQSQADLFISIHHNSNIENKKINDLMLFYKMTDPGRSQDVAHEVCAALKDKLQTKTAKIFPGNYHVLRHNDAPAILGEASFITNNENETRLSFHRTLSVEAEGYFAGIMNYYRKGIPAITDAYPKDVVLPSAQPTITTHLYPGSDSSSIDASSIEVLLDHKPVDHFSFQDEALITFTPPTPLRNGKHQYCISARNSLGNTSGKMCTVFWVSLPPGEIKLSPIFSKIPADGIARTPIDIEVLDAEKKPVMDGTEVMVSATGGKFLHPSLLTKQGEARAVLFSQKPPQKITVTAKSGDVVAQGHIEFGIPEEALLIATVRDPAGNPIEKVKLVRNNQVVDYSDATGFLYDQIHADGEISYEMIKTGYAPLSFTRSVSTGTQTVVNLCLDPIDHGVFFNRKIILDPAENPTRSRPVITQLKKKIENAGGKAILMWDRPPAPSAQQRLVKASKENADIFLAFEMTRNELSIGYYFKSTPGEMLAGLICENLKANKIGGKGECRLVTSIHYVIIQTPMPALWVSLPESSIASAELAADSIYQALAAFFKQNDLT